MSQRPELCFCEKICEFRCGRWHTTHYLVATDAGKHYAIPLRAQTHPDLRRSATVVAGSRHEAFLGGFGRWFGRGFFFRIPRTDIDMPAGTAAFFFDCSEIGALVPVGFGVVVVGDSVEARGFAAAAGEDGIRHADDGRRVPPATKFGEDRAIGTETALDGRGEDAAEVLFVFRIRAVMDSLVRIEIPILTDGVVSGPKKHERGRRNGVDANAG